MHLCLGYGYELTPLAMLESERNVSARTMPTSVACTVIYSQGVLQMQTAVEGHVWPASMSEAPLTMKSSAGSPCHRDHAG